MKTRIVSAAGLEGFDFLGYHFQGYQDGRGTKYPRKKSHQKLRDTLAAKLHSGRSGGIPTIIEEINKTLKGWLGYFKYSRPSALRSIDQWKQAATIMAYSAPQTETARDGQRSRTLRIPEPMV